MIDFDFSFTFHISSRRAKACALMDWIDDEMTGRQAQAREHFWQVFPAMAERLWEHLAARLTRDAGRLSKVFPAEIKEAMRVNGREQMPHRNQIFIDNPAYPSIELEIELDTLARSIHIRQLRREALESTGRESHERLLLDLDRNDEIVIKDIDGEILSVEGVSKYVLQRFLRR